MIINYYVNLNLKYIKSYITRFLIRDFTFARSFGGKNQNFSEIGK